MGQKKLDSLDKSWSLSHTHTLFTIIHNPKYVRNPLLYFAGTERHIITGRCMCFKPVSMCDYSIYWIDEYEKNPKINIFYNLNFSFMESRRLTLVGLVVRVESYLQHYISDSVLVLISSRYLTIPFTTLSVSLSVVDS